MYEEGGRDFMKGEKKGKVVFSQGTKKLVHPLISMIGEGFIQSLKRKEEREVCYSPMQSVGMYCQLILMRMEEKWFQSITKKWESR
jgi:hypothetical protein